MSGALPARIALVLALAASGSSGSTHGRAPVCPDTPPAEETAAPAVTLTELRAAPVHHLAGRVQFVLQVCQPSADWNPFHTRFTPEDWVGLSAWGDERFAWQPDVWADPATRLFALRGTAAAGAFEHARPGERFAVEGRVRAVFAGQPWIEITQARQLERMVGQGTLLCASRALEAMSGGRWQRAVQELDRALAAFLPLHARAELERMRAECRVRAAAGDRH